MKTTLAKLFHHHGTGVQAIGETDNTSVTVHAITTDGYALCTSLEEGALGSMAIYDAHLEHWSHKLPARTLHMYRMRSISSGDQKFFPVCTYGFETQEDAIYFANQHSFTIIAYVGEEKLP